MAFNYEKNLKLSGIYEIINKVNGKRYIGSAKKFIARWNNHINLLRKNKHHNSHFQNSFNKYFEILESDVFIEFNIVEILKNSTKQERLEREEYWIKFCKEEGIGIYNKNLEPTKQEGKVWSHDPKETLEKKRKPNSGQFGKGRICKHSNEAKRRIGQANAKTYDLSQNPLIGPNNQIVVEIQGLAEFCRANNLSFDLSSVLNGRQKTHRGWKLKNTIKKASAAKIYENFGTLISPQG